MFYTIYQITNKINGKIYIGKHQTTDLNDGYMGSGKILRRAQEKHGLDSFVKDILYVFETEEEMNAKEKELVTEEFCLMNTTYNLCQGGHGGFSFINREGKHLYGKNGQSGYGLENLKDWTGLALSEEHKAKISQSLKGQQTWWIGKTHCEESKRKIGEKNSIAQSGNKNSQFGSMWITNGTENKKIKSIDNIPETWYKGRVIKKVIAE
jgi:group I intron endonuclease